MKKLLVTLSAVSVLALVAGCGGNGCFSCGKKESSRKQESHKVSKKSKPAHKSWCEKCKAWVDKEVHKHM